MTSYDVILRGGRLIDPATNRDEIADIAFAGGKIAASGASLNGLATIERDVEGAIVMPGMIDFHAHVYWGGTSLGVDADALSKRCGTTTWLDVGSAGAGNFAGFRKHVIEQAQTKIFAYLHVSFAGIYGFSKEVMIGESLQMGLINPEVCARVALEHPDLIKGIKVRIGANTSGPNGIEPLHLAMRAAEGADLPVMCHIDNAPPRYEDVLDVLRPGDTLTHAFRPWPNSPVDAKGRIRDAVHQAREKGIIFDIAHGKGSFSFKTAQAMLEGGFLPDIISSDVHMLCIDGPAFDNLETMSKFLAMGMDLAKIVEASSTKPAQVLGCPELADLSNGSTGDVTVLRIEEGNFEFVDVLGVKMIGHKRFALDSIVLDGALWHATC